MTLTIAKVLRKQLAALDISGLSQAEKTRLRDYLEQVSRTLSRVSCPKRDTTLTQRREVHT